MEMTLHVTMNIQSNPFVQYEMPRQIFFISIQLK